MYASKRRQRNFKRVRDTSKRANEPSNPSKRHRERLNGELETVAGLLPYEQHVVQRLDKLSVLRLAVSYLHLKAHFHACAHSTQLHNGRCPKHPLAGFSGSSPFSASASPGVQLQIVPTIVSPRNGMALVDPQEPLFSNLVQKALGGFVLILNQNAEIYYVTENIETYLGFLQSDVLHQSVFEMIHSEDRESLRKSLTITESNETLIHRSIVARFRCLLDNTCGFVRVEISGRMSQLHGVQGASPACAYAENLAPRFALIAVCTPFVPPLQMDPSMDDPILKTKHSLDLSFTSIDNRLHLLLELESSSSSVASVGLALAAGSSAIALGTITASPASIRVSGQSFYSFVHPEDAKFVAEAHESVIKYCSSGLIIYRLQGRISGVTLYLQSSLRLFFKNGKPESIGGNHRLLTEVDGQALLEKRNSLKFKFVSFDDTLLQSPRILPVQQNANSQTTVPAQNTIAGVALKETLMTAPVEQSQQYRQQLALQSPNFVHFTSPPFPTGNDAKIPYSNLENYSQQKVSGSVVYGNELTQFAYQKHIVKENDNLIPYDAGPLAQCHSTSLNVQSNEKKPKKTEKTKKTKKTEKKRNAKNVKKDANATTCSGFSTVNCSSSLVGYDYNEIASSSRHNDSVNTSDTDSSNTVNTAHMDADAWRGVTSNYDDYCTYFHLSQQYYYPNFAQQQQQQHCLNTIASTSSSSSSTVSHPILAAATGTVTQNFNLYLGGWQDYGGAIGAGYSNYNPPYFNNSNFANLSYNGGGATKYGNEIVDTRLLSQQIQYPTPSYPIVSASATVNPSIATVAPVSVIERIGAAVTPTTSLFSKVESSTINANNIKSATVNLLPKSISSLLELSNSIITPNTVTDAVQSRSTDIVDALKPIKLHSQPECSQANTVETLTTNIYDLTHHNHQHSNPSYYPFTVGNYDAAQYINNTVDERGVYEINNGSTILPTEYSSANGVVEPIVNSSITVAGGYFQAPSGFNFLSEVANTLLSQ